jgi:6-phosphogluconolactonase
MSAVFQTYPSRAALFAGLAKLVGSELRTTLASNTTATLAVPGGTTPAPFFKHLRQIDLDWPHTRVLLTDERFVPETSERSNTRLLREHLLQGLAARAELVPLYYPANQVEDVLAPLTRGIRAVLPLDVCVLGMGADMHTASLFAGADLLQQALAPDAPPLLPMRAPGAPEPRLTLTAPVLQQAAHVHILITGPEKKRALEEAIKDGPVTQAPVRIVLKRKGPTTVHYAE